MTAIDLTKALNATRKRNEDAAFAFGGAIRERDEAFRASVLADGMAYAEHDFLIGRATADLAHVRKEPRAAARAYLLKFWTVTGDKRPADIKAARERAASAKSAMLKKLALVSASANAGRGGRPAKKSAAPKPSPGASTLIGAGTPEAAALARAAVPVVTGVASVADWAARELVALQRVQAQAAQSKAWRVALATPYAALLAALKAFERDARALADAEASKAEARDERADAKERPKATGKPRTTRGK